MFEHRRKEPSTLSSTHHEYGCGAGGWNRAHVSHELVARLECFDPKWKKTRVINFDNAYTFTLWRRKVIIYVDHMHATELFAFELRYAAPSCATCATNSRTVRIFGL